MSDFLTGVFQPCNGSLDILRAKDAWEVGIIWCETQGFEIGSVVDGRGDLVGVRVNSFCGGSREDEVRRKLKQYHCEASGAADSIATARATEGCFHKEGERARKQSPEI